jgi:hypothetical protein
VHAHTGKKNTKTLRRQREKKKENKPKKYRATIHGPLGISQKK